MDVVRKISLSVSGYNPGQPVLFGYEADAIMAVSHHDDPAMYKTYVVHSAHVDHTFLRKTIPEY